MFKNIIKPILVLSLICLAVAVLLAVVNFVTKPIIEEATVKAEQAARAAVLPSANDFSEVALSDYEGIPETVVTCYAADGGLGYVFTVKAAGYGGKSSPITFLIGITQEGKIAGVKVTDASGESAGIGDKVKKSDFTNRFDGVGTEDLSNVETISGATISSSGFKAGVADAFTAFATVKGGKQ